MVGSSVAIAVLFPGQGTQTPGMGEPWRSTPAWDIVERAEKALDLPLAHLDRPFEYSVPESLGATAQPGVRVLSWRHMR